MAAIWLLMLAGISCLLSLSSRFLSMRGDPIAASFGLRDRRSTVIGLLALPGAIEEANSKNTVVKE